MKKFHKKAIHSQARTLEMLVNDIKSIKKGRKMAGGAWYCFSRDERAVIKATNGDHYIPTKLKEVVRSMSDNQKASVMRELLTDSAAVITDRDTVYNFRQKFGRTYRMYGNFHSVKAKLCNHLLYMPTLKFLKGIAKKHDIKMTAGDFSRMGAFATKQVLTNQIVERLRAMTPEQYQTELEKHKNSDIAAALRELNEFSNFNPENTNGITHV